METDASELLLWRSTTGAEPCAVKAASTVLNGGDEETCGNVTRLVPTQLRQQVSASVSGDLPPSDPQEHPPPPHPWRLTFSAPRYMMCS
jgi:hypothetical protein